MSDENSEQSETADQENPDLMQSPDRQEALDPQVEERERSQEEGMTDPFGGTDAGTGRSLDDLTSDNPDEPAGSNMPAAPPASTVPPG